MISDCSFRQCPISGEHLTVTGGKDRFWQSKILKADFGMAATNTNFVRIAVVFGTVGNLS